MNDPVPATDQIAFLSKIQRLLNEGSFVATYKYALLLALADICVEDGNDSGAPMRIPTAALADKFILYYWRQVRPFNGTRLRYGTGKTPAIVSAVAEMADTQARPLSEVRRNPLVWKPLARKVERTIIEMPLFKLQTVGNQREDYFYANQLDAGSIELKPGIAFCFRKFHALVGDVVRGAWVRYVRRHNALDPSGSLDQFLFGSERANLEKFVPILREAQSGACLYCGSPVQQASSHVDHFIPWSRYPADLGHNLVLTHARCNLAKSDHLAASEHLQNWVARNRDAGEYLTGQFDRIQALSDLESSNRIARWAYAQASAAQSPLWLRAKQFVSVEANWETLLD